MNRITLAAVVLLAGGLPAFGQPIAPETRAVGVHTPVRGDTPELARQLARVDGQRKAWQAASKELQTRKDVQALRLTAAQVEAFTAVIVETSEVATRTPAPAAGTALQLPLRVRFERGHGAKTLC